ncbi:DNA-binding protein, partial [Pseudomonas aeruginosa]|nr:DNA-binding protein [Pseudomonas aeruginosa]
FRQRGITITQWAAEHGYKRNAVYRVLNGFDKANYGQAHDIAVALGLKACDPVAA